MGNIKFELVLGHPLSQRVGGALHGFRNHPQYDLKTTTHGRRGFAAHAPGIEYSGAGVAVTADGQRFEGGDSTRFGQVVCLGSLW